MSSVTHPKGRLPARVYWFRRAMVLLVAFGLVFLLAQLLGGNGSDPATKAVDKAAPAAKKTAAPPAQVGPVAVETTAAKKKAPVVLASPDGACEAREVAVAPSVRKAYAGRKSWIKLNFTSTRAACTFDVSPTTLVVRISSGSDSIWTSQQCKAAIPRKKIVVRSSTPTSVWMAWGGQRSDEDCSVSAPFARAGFYHVTAAALGSEPGDVQFELQNPPRAVITKTAKPKPTKTKKKQSQSAKPTHTPSGAVEPDQTSR